MVHRANLLKILPIMGLAFGLRVVGLPDLHLSGDAAWTVYLALKSLPELTLATATDSHPPLYYYLLHFWMGPAGVSELSVRFLSAFTGLLTVAVTFKAGQRLLGTSGGVLASVLAALSPFLVYFDRMPRMYSLLALLAALALYLVLRLISLGAPSRNPARSDSRRAGARRPQGSPALGPGPLPSVPGPRRGGIRLRLMAALYFAVMLAALYTHYFGVFLMAAGFMPVAVAWRSSRRALLGWAAGHVAILVLFLPWLAYILGPSVAATTQAYGAIDLARPSNLLSLLSRFWIALNVGDMLEVGESRALALALSIIWGVALLVALRKRKTPEGVQIPLALLVPAGFVVLPLLANMVAFAATPYVPFTRLMILSAPAFLVLAAWLLAGLWRASRLGAGLGTALALGLLAYSLAGTFYVERASADIEAVEVARRVAPLGGPDDAVIFQALWHAGYFRSHAGARFPAAHVLAEEPLSDLPGLLDRRPRLWLSMFTSGKREALYPQEEWLDTNAYKAQEFWKGRLRLSLYGGRPDPPLKAVGADFGDVIRLEAAGVAPKTVRPGDVVRLYLRWRALQDPGKKYVAFVHMVDENGRGCTGRDGEPVDGLRPTESWSAGDTIDDRRGLLVGPGVPPGRYYLALGLYDRQDWTRRLPVRGGGQDRLLLGPLEVVPQASESVRGEPLASFGPAGIDLMSYRTDVDKKVRVVRNVDGPVELWLPGALRPGGRAPVTLQWRTGVPLAHAYRLRLEMVDSLGRVRGQAAERPLGGTCPSFRWAAGEVVEETVEIDVHPDAPASEYRLRATLYPQQGDQPAAGPLVFGSLRLEGKAAQ